MSMYFKKCPLMSIDFHICPLISTEFNWFPLISIYFNGFPWISIDFHWFQLIFHWFQTISMDVHWCQLTTIVFHILQYISIDFTWFHWFCNRAWFACIAAQTKCTDCYHSGYVLVPKWPRVKFSLLPLLHELCHGCGMGLGWLVKCECAACCQSCTGALRRLGALALSTDLIREAKLERMRLCLIPEKAGQQRRNNIQVTTENHTVTERNKI